MTAIQANLRRQTPATVAVTHYYDVKRTCQDCGRMFLFFALEQKHWYEVLGFPLEADCVRCFPCRKQRRGQAYKRERYEELFSVQHRTMGQNIEMVDCALTLIESAQFGRRQLERVRMLLNQIRAATSSAPGLRYQQLLERVKSLEANPPA